MTKIAVLDLDGQGQVVNNDARFEKAKEARAAYLQVALSRHNPMSGRDIDEGAIDTYWRAAFKPEMVELDTLQPGAISAIEFLRDRDYYIMFLTSRPAYMRQATEAWLIHRSINYEMVMKDYGTTEDPRDRFVKTKIWKAKKVQEIWNDLLPETLLFVDDQEENREAIADIGNPRIVVKYSLQDAMETDLTVIPQHSKNASELLMFCESLANAACVRHRFESDEKFILRVEHKPVTGQEYRAMPLVVRAANKGDRRFVSVTELWPLKDGRVIEALTVAMNAHEGKVVDVVIGDINHTPIQLSDLTTDETVTVEYSHPFTDQEADAAQRMMQGFADWKAKNLREAMYIEAAKYQREVKLWEARAHNAYLEAIEEASRKIRAAFRGGTESERTSDERNC